MAICKLSLLPKAEDFCLFLGTKIRALPHGRATDTIVESTVLLLSRKFLADGKKCIRDFLGASRKAGHYGSRHLVSHFAGRSQGNQHPQAGAQSTFSLGQS